MYWDNDLVHSWERVWDTKECSQRRNTLRRFYISVSLGIGSWNHCSVQRTSEAFMQYACACAVLHQQVLSHTTRPIICVQGSLRIGKGKVLQTKIQSNDATRSCRFWVEIRRQSGFYSPCIKKDIGTLACQQQLSSLWAFSDLHVVFGSLMSITLGCTLWRMLN